MSEAAALEEYGQAIFGEEYKPPVTKRRTFVKRAIPITVPEKAILDKLGEYGTSPPIITPPDMWYPRFISDRKLVEIKDLEEYWKQPKEVLDLNRFELFPVDRYNKGKLEYSTHIMNDIIQKSLTEYLKNIDRAIGRINEAIVNGERIEGLEQIVSLLLESLTNALNVVSTVPSKGQICELLRASGNRLESFAKGNTKFVPFTNARQICYREPRPPVPPPVRVQSPPAAKIAPKVKVQPPVTRPPAIRVQPPVAKVVPTAKGPVPMGIDIFAALSP